MMKNIVYPAIVTKEEDEGLETWKVEFPGIYMDMSVCGDSFDDAVRCAESYLWGEMEFCGRTGKEYPKPPEIGDIKLKQNQRLVFIHTTAKDGNRLPHWSVDRDAAACSILFAQSVKEVILISQRNVDSLSDTDDNRGYIDYMRGYREGLINAYRMYLSSLIDGHRLFIDPEEEFW